MQNRYDISKLWRCSILQIVQSQKLSIKVSPNAKKVVHIQKSLLAPQYKVIPWSVIDRYIMVQEPGALTYFLKDKYGALNRVYIITYVYSIHIKK